MMAESHKLVRSLKVVVGEPMEGEKVGEEKDGSSGASGPSSSKYRGLNIVRAG